MVASQPVDIAVNPNDKSQFYVLHGNGRIEPHGGLPEITDNTTWFHRIDQPVAVAIHVSDWNSSPTPKGQVLDFQGGFQPFGGAPDYMDASGDWPVNTLGIVYVDHRRYVGWSWNPTSTGGYCIDLYGHLFPFGGESAPPRGGNRFSTPAVRGFTMRWTPDKRAYTLDMSGAVWPDFAAVPAGTGAPYFKGRDVARDLAITDWATGAGYTLTGDGAAHAFNGAAASGTAGPYRAGADVARVLDVISAEDPTRLRQVHSGGQVYEYVASGPPTVTAGGSLSVSPAATTTDTTRPVLAWDYSDPDRDSQAAWELYVFTEAFVSGHSMTDPSVWAADALVAMSGINPTTRGVTSTVDLPNDSYRLYVRAKDTGGQWSAWDDHAWTQNVPVPTTPTGMTATADAASFSVLLQANTAADSDLLRFEFSDDGGVTWLPVRGADELPAAATATGADRDAPQGAQRAYRAVAYSVDPRTASAPSSTATATLDAATYLLTATDDPTLGGSVRVQEPVGWSRPVGGGKLQGLGADFVTTLSDGRPKGRETKLVIFCEDEAAWETVEALAEADSTLVYRNPFGEVLYCRLDPGSSWDRELMSGSATQHRHTTQLSLVEVRPPHLPVVDELA